MKKALFAALLMYPLLSVLAQEAAVAEPPYPSGFPFSDVVISCGLIGIFIWITIFSLVLFGLISGIKSVIACAKTKNLRPPLVFMLLV